MKYLIIIIVLFSTHVYAKDYSWLKENKIYSLSDTQKWDKVDRNLFFSFTILQTIDCFQTREIFKNPEYNELNPLIKKVGKKNVITYFAGATIGCYFITKHLKPKPRRTFLTVLNSFQLINVGRNHRIGVRLQF